MPLGKSRLKPDKSSFSGSLKDGLYDQLLHSLTGTEGFATEAEVRAYYRSKCGTKWSLCEVDPLAPWPVQRKQAYTAVTLFTRDEYWRCVYGLWECQSIDDDECSLSDPPDKEAVYRDWSIWRAKLVKQYYLPPLPEDFLETTPPDAFPNA